MHVNFYSSTVLCVLLCCSALYYNAILLQHTYIHTYIHTWYSAFTTDYEAVWLHQTAYRYRMCCSERYGKSYNPILTNSHKYVYRDGKFLCKDGKIVFAFTNIGMYVYWILVCVCIEYWYVCVLLIELCVTGHCKYVHEYMWCNTFMNTFNEHMHEYINHMYTYTHIPSHVSRC
jgi:hypothetical protein